MLNSYIDLSYTLTEYTDVSPKKQRIKPASPHKHEAPLIPKIMRSPISKSGTRRGSTNLGIRPLTLSRDHGHSSTL